MSVRTRQQGGRTVDGQAFVGCAIRRALGTQAGDEQGLGIVVLHCIDSQRLAHGAAGPVRGHQQARAQRAFAGAVRNANGSLCSIDIAEAQEPRGR